MNKCLVSFVNCVWRRLIMILVNHSIKSSLWDLKEFFKSTIFFCWLCFKSGMITLFCFLWDTVEDLLELSGDSLMKKLHSLVFLIDKQRTWGWEVFSKEDSWADNFWWSKSPMWLCKVVLSSTCSWGRAPLFCVETCSSLNHGVFKSQLLMQCQAQFEPQWLLPKNYLQLHQKSWNDSEIKGYSLLHSRNSSRNPHFLYQKIKLRMWD